MDSLKARKDFIMSIVIDSSVIPYLIYIFAGVFLIFVILMVYTGRRDGHII